MDIRTRNRIRSLRHIPTTTTRHIAAKPPQSGTVHLDMYLLDMERQRLEQELAHLDDRRGRISERIGRIINDLAALRQVAEQAGTCGTGQGAAAGTIATPLPRAQAQPRWKTLAIGY